MRGNTMNAIMPPIGVDPKFSCWRIRLKQRYCELMEAIARYEEAGTPVPQEWLNELGENFKERQLLVQKPTEALGLSEHIPLFVQLTDNNSSLHLIQPNNIVQIYQSDGADRRDLGDTCIVLSAGPNIYVNVSPDEVLRKLG
jgi:hypothetical protein